MERQHWSRVTESGTGGQPLPEFCGLVECRLPFRRSPPRHAYDLYPWSFDPVVSLRTHRRPRASAYRGLREYGLNQKNRWGNEIPLLILLERRNGNDFARTWLVKEFDA
jgi:hypothetical protein